MKLRLAFIVAAIPTLAIAGDDHAAIEPLLKHYCVRCHGPVTAKSDLRLDRLNELDGGQFQNVYERLADRTMPPDDERQPTPSDRERLVQHMLELASTSSVMTATGLRRLNKREYSNTVRDLLGLRQGVFDPGEYIYDDEVDEGFDTAAESLVISNELLMEYMEAGDKSLRQALFIEDTKRPESQTIKINVMRMRGIGGSRYINNDKGRTICRCGGKAMIFDGQSTRTVQTPGRYTITITAAGVDRDNYPVRFAPADGPIVMGVGVKQDVAASVSSKNQLLKEFELQDDVDETFQFDLWIDKGFYPYISFVNGSSKPITQVRSYIRRRKIDQSAMKEPYRGPGVRVSRFQIEGPFFDEWPPPSIRTTFDADEIPDLADTSARRDLLVRFATRAFRRPATSTELVSYEEYLHAQHAGNVSWHEATIRTLAAMMSSVDFLFIREGSGQLDGYELASRLSYFFWSTMPDAELLSLAKSGKLTDPSVLEEQVVRLLGDARASRFCDSFATQWLSLDELGTMPPDAKGEFRSYYRNNLEPAMLEETKRFFAHVLQENRSIRDFIDCDYSFINRDLAELYGVPFDGPKNGFARVSFEPQSNRGGLLGHGSILTLTANGVDTSPVERGVWVLADLLGTPPPPPPKEVPALTPDLNGAETVRDLLEKHRSDAACMECHRRMDPLGFALEAYDPIGRFRTRYSKTQTVSTHGNYLGEDFTDVVELKQILTTDIRPFARNLAIRIAEYAKGRELVASDYEVVTAILDAAEKENFRLRDLVVAITTGRLMTHR